MTVNQADAAAFHLAASGDLEPPDSGSARRRSHLALRLGRVETAHADYARWLAEGAADAGDAWLSCARLFLFQRDRQAYRQLCERMLAAFEKDRPAAEPYYAARTLGLAPCSPAEADRLLRLLQPERPARPFSSHQFFGLAMAHYWAAQWEKADAALLESIKRDPNGAWRGLPLLAMILHRLGRAREARNHLSEARDRLERHRTEDRKSDHTLFNGEWFDFEVLCREAETLINPDPYPIGKEDAPKVVKPGSP
jgi:tetratricopeptide (TPR) repeat protein